MKSLQEEEKRPSPRFAIEPIEEEPESERLESRASEASLYSLVPKEEDEDMLDQKQSNATNNKVSRLEKKLTRRYNINDVMS